MAAKSIEMSKLKELIRLHKEQVSNRKIGRMLGMDKKTVGKYVKLVDKDPLGPDGLLKLSDTDLLIVDDFGLVKLSGQQLIDFMEIIEDRHARKSTIIASQLPIAEWYDVLAKNKTIADSIIDRIVKTSYRFELKGDSLRKKVINFAAPSVSPYPKWGNMTETGGGLTPK